MTISLIQIGAALGSLGWSYETLSQKSGVSLNAIAKAMGRTTKPSTTTLNKFKSAFEAESIIFTANHGVARKPEVETFTLYEKEGFRKVMDMVYQTASTEGGDICIFNGRPYKFIEWLGREWYDAHKDRMLSKQDNYTLRIIVKDKTKEKIGSEIAQYGFIDNDLFSNASIYVFGDHIATFNFENELSVNITKQRSLADWNRSIFDFIWKEKVTSI